MHVINYNILCLKKNLGKDYAYTHTRRQFFLTKKYNAPKYKRNSFFDNLLFECYVTQ